MTRATGKWKLRAAGCIDFPVVYELLGDIVIFGEKVLNVLGWEGKERRGFLGERLKFWKMKRKKFGNYENEVSN